MGGQGPPASGPHKSSSADDNGPSPTDSLGNRPTQGPPSPEQRSRAEVLDNLQTALDIGGMLPGIGLAFDVVNAGIHAARGNWGEAALSLAGAVPGVGDALKGAVLAKKAYMAAHVAKALAATQTLTQGGTLGIAALKGASHAKQGGVYVLKNRAGTVLRTGRSSDLVTRRTAHSRYPETGDLDFKVVHETNSYFEQRGLEHLEYLRHAPTATLNKIRAISPLNPLKPLYISSAKEYLARHGKEIPKWFK